MQISRIKKKENFILLYEENKAEAIQVTENKAVGRVFVIEKKRSSLPLGGLALFIYPYDKYFNMKPYHFMSNQRICSWIDSNDESL